jgi:hypothetical protein
MASAPAPHQPIQFNNTLWARGAMVAILGSVLVAVGMFLGGTAVFSAARQWIKQLETPPSETARDMFHHIQAATSAGAKAWKVDAHHNGVGIPT